MQHLKKFNNKIGRPPKAVFNYKIMELKYPGPAKPLIIVYNKTMYTEIHY